MMQVTVRLFSALRERVGAGNVDLSVNGSTVFDVIEAAIAEYPQIAPFRSVIRCAVNREYVSEETAVISGDELAFITPVSGG